MKRWFIGNIKHHCYYVILLAKNWSCWRDFHKHFLPNYCSNTRWNGDIPSPSIAASLHHNIIIYNIIAPLHLSPIIVITLWLTSPFLKILILYKHISQMTNDYLPHLSSLFSGASHVRRGYTRVARNKCNLRLRSHPYYMYPV